MATWPAVLGFALLSLTSLACSDGDEGAAPNTTEGRPTTTTADEPAPRPTSTTTTAYDPGSVEGQVEAAYLKSWDVYADAVYHLRLDEQALANIFADPLLSVVRDELRSRITENRAAHVRVEHQYSVELTGPDTAAVVDRYTNHQVLIDPTTKVPVEPDPQAVILDAFTLRHQNGRWVVFDQRRVR